MASSRDFFRSAMVSVMCDGAALSVVVIVLSLIERERGRGQSRGVHGVYIIYYCYVEKLQAACRLFKVFTKKRETNDVSISSMTTDRKFF